ncbi:MAG: patatin-like phospholipase family protein [Gemmatimonadaceae bacterium]|nr:patatin-like phospholipase family protein [Gemmatimonadaceae bacterium]
MRSFALVLSGGGARGFAHLGVLRALEHVGARPSAVVGVSMGGAVGTIHGMRTDWYEATLGLRLPEIGDAARPRLPGRQLWSALRTAVTLLFSFGPGTRVRESALRELRRVIGDGDLRDTRIPVWLAATDLLSGKRVTLREGSAVENVYASAALAGVVPPLPRGDLLLADGAYADVAPVDLARALAPDVVIAVDAGPSDHPPELRNGYQVAMRAIDICHRRHAELRFAAADLVLRPRFLREVDTLDFAARRECVAAGIRAVRAARGAIAVLLGDGADPTPQSTGVLL